MSHHKNIAQISGETSGGGKCCQVRADLWGPPGVLKTGETVAVCNCLPLVTSHLHTLFLKKILLLPTLNLDSRQGVFYQCIQLPVVLGL